MTNADDNTIQTPTGKRVSLIEDKLDPDRMSQVQLGSKPGDLFGVKFESMLQVMEFSKLMAIGGTAIPPHLRGNPGGCLAVTVRALELQMSPFTVANWSYEVDNKGVKRIAFEAAFYIAVVLARAPIKEPTLQTRWEGHGDARKCFVFATFKGDDKPSEWPPRDCGDEFTLGKLRPSRNDYGKIKGSPLWDTMPDQQQFYAMARLWARRYCPHILAGLSTHADIDEIEQDHIGPDNAKDVTASTLGERLRARTASSPAVAAPREGFSDQAIHAHIEAAVAAATPKSDTSAVPSDTKRGKRTTVDGTASEVVDADSGRLSTTEASAGDPAPPQSAEASPGSDQSSPPQEAEK